MPAQKRPNYQDLASAFMTATISLRRVTGQDELIVPEEHLLYHEGERAFYVYDRSNGVWRIIPDEDKDTGPFARLIEQFWLDNYPALNVSTALLKELRLAISRKIKRRYNEKTHGLSPYTAFKDGLFNWKTFELEPHDKEKLVFHALPINFPHQPSPTPLFDAYLARTFPNDPQLQQFIPTVLGYYLLPNTKEPAAFYLQGKARTGKSTLLDLIVLIIGEQFSCSYDLKSLTTDKFVVSQLAGYRLNYQDEDESEYIDPSKLKALVSQRPMSAQRKFEQPFTFRPRCKFLFASNQMPNFRNVDDGLKRRLYFIEFNNVLPKKEQDKHFDEKIQAELPGIIYKAIQSAKAFVENNEEFEFPDSVVSVGEKFAIEAEPVHLFFHENYIVTTPEGAVDFQRSEWTSSTALYDHYKEWSNENRKNPKSSPKFYKALEQIPGLESAKDSKGERFKNCKKRSTFEPFADKSQALLPQLS